MKKSKISDLLKSDLMFFNVTCNNKEDLLKMICEDLFNKGYVKNSFYNAIIEREKIYPTALPTVGVKVAIPHTDVEHVNKPCIAFFNLNNTIKFKEMGNGINDIDVEMGFVLVTDDKKSQVHILQSLISLFMNEQFLLSLKQSSTAHQVIQTIESNISS